MASLPWRRDEAEVLRTRRRTHDPDALYERPARAALRRLCARPLLRTEYRPRADARDHHRDRGVQYWTSDKLALAAVGREDRHAGAGARAARDGRAALRDGRPAEAARRHHPEQRPERVRDRAQPEARRRRGHAGAAAAARAAGGRGGARPRALARREPRRADHDPRELLRDARRADHALRLLLRACSAASAAAAEPQQQQRRQPGAGLADHLRWSRSSPTRSATS